MGKELYLLNKLITAKLMLELLNFNIDYIYFFRKTGHVLFFFNNKNKQTCFYRRKVNELLFIHKINKMIIIHPLK